MKQSTIKLTKNIFAIATVLAASSSFAQVGHESAIEVERDPPSVVGQLDVSPLIKQLSASYATKLKFVADEIASAERALKEAQDKLDKTPKRKFSDHFTFLGDGDKERKENYNKAKVARDNAAEALENSRQKYSQIHAAIRKDTLDYLYKNDASFRKRHERRKALNSVTQSASVSKAKINNALNYINDAKAILMRNTERNFFGSYEWKWEDDKKVPAVNLEPLEGESAEQFTIRKQQAELDRAKQIERNRDALDETKELVNKRANDAFAEIRGALTATSEFSQLLSAAAKNPDLKEIPEVDSIMKALTSNVGAIGGGSLSLQNISRLQQKIGGQGNTGFFYNSAPPVAELESAQVELSSLLNQVGTIEKPLSSESAKLGQAMVTQSEKLDRIVDEQVLRQR